MLALLLPFLGGLINPILNYLTKRQDAQVQIYMAKTGADRDTAIAAIQATAAIQGKWWFVAALQPLFALPFVIYTWKVVLWDIVFKLGETDAIHGTVGWVYTIVVSSVFVHGITSTFLTKK